MLEKPKRKFGKEEPHPSNVLWLVKALLLLAKGDLKLEDSQLISAVKVDWVTENTLLVTTGNLLSSVEKQLKGWVADARIVLTCRLNVWDVGKNDLYTFEKYRVQQLSYPDMVDKFIRRFFFKADEPTKGEKLIEKLERSQPRIRDLVKNPLRLTLLCRTWKKRQGELPQTKAELYKGFVETFYEWNDKPEIDQDKRPLLNQALGELAKNAIDKETTKFRLRKSFVCQELDKFDKSLFDLACRVSWINNVGVAAENPDEPVYAGILRIVHRPLQRGISQRFEQIRQSDLCHH